MVALTRTGTLLINVQAAPAPPPQNDMQKYLARWRD